MRWLVGSEIKRFWVVRVGLVGAVLAGELILLREHVASRAADAKAPAVAPAAKADLPDMPAPAPKEVLGAEKAPPASPSASAPSPPEGQPPEKAPPTSPAEPKPAPGTGTPTTPPQPKSPAEPAAQPQAEPPTTPKADTPPQPEKELPGKEKMQPPATPKAETPAKEKTTTPLLEWPVDESHRKNRAEVSAVLRAGSLNADQIKFLTDYYTQYGLARWTQIGNRAEVRKYREELLRELAQAEGQAHDQLIQIVLPLLIKMAEGNHHPAARVNAVLAVGELNRVESKEAKPPEPLPAAQPFLLQTSQSPQMPEALRVAALVGLRRHAELGAVGDQTKAQWTNVLLGIVQERPPSSRSAPGHDWLRHLAIEVLEVLKTPGPNGQVVISLTDVLSDTNNPMTLRVRAARALGNLDYSQGFPGDLNKLLREMGQLALDALTAELETHQKEKIFQARRLQTYFIGIYIGLTGLEKAASPSKETAALYQKILAAVRDCAVLFDSPKLRDSDGKLRENELIQQLSNQKPTLTEAITAPASPTPLPAAKQKPTSGG